MHLAYILIAAVSTLSALQVPVTASVGSDVALTGAFGADQSVSGQSRFLRGNEVAEEEEERRLVDVKGVVDKLMRTNSFSALKEVDGLVTLNKIEAEAVNHMTSAFKFAADSKMLPKDLAAILKTYSDLDDKFIDTAVKLYTKHFERLSKAH